MHILNLEKSVEFDESITHYQERNILPKTGTNYDKLGEIRFVLQNPEIYTHPAKSYIYIEGVIQTNLGGKPKATRLSNNGLAFLFEEVRYEINSIEIDRTRNVGITTSMKNYVSLGKSSGTRLSNSGWDPKHEFGSVVDDDGHFSACIPLNMLLGFADDYHKIVICQQNLTLVRSRSDENCYEMKAATTATNPVEKCDITINKIIWKLPFVRLGDASRLRLYNMLQSKKIIYLSFRSFELMEYPVLPATPNQVWSVRTMTSLERPRYVIVGFQTERKNTAEACASNFDHCNLVDVKLFLNEEVYPYENLDLDFGRNQYSLLFEMYTKFQENYYEGRKKSEPMLSMAEFKSKAPLIVIDCSRQVERVKTGSVDVRLEFRSKNNFPANTTAYCLILHDRVIEVNLIDNKITKL